MAMLSEHPSIDHAFVGASNHGDQHTLLGDSPLYLVQRYACINDAATGETPFFTAAWRAVIEQPQTHAPLQQSEHKKNKTATKAALRFRYSQTNEKTVQASTPFIPV